MQEGSKRWPAVRPRPSCKHSATVSLYVGCALVVQKDLKERCALRTKRVVVRDVGAHERHAEWQGGLRMPGAAFTEHTRRHKAEARLFVRVREQTQAGRVCALTNPHRMVTTIQDTTRI